MSTTPKNAVSQHLAALAHKLASGPDRMTVNGNDGEGGITTEKGTIPKDGGEALVRADIPANAAVRTTTTPDGSPDRMTVAGNDGEGGITTEKGTIKADPGLAEVRSEIPENAAVRKSAAARINSIRAAVTTANPQLGARLPSQPAGTPAAAIHKAAGSVAAQGGPTLDCSEVVLAKIARQILATDEGMSLAYAVFEKEAGEKAAAERISEAIAASHQFDAVEREKSASINDGMTKAASLYTSLCQYISESDADEIIKTAHVHQTALDELSHPMLKQAYAQGMDDAAAIEGAEEAGPIPGGEGDPAAEGAPPEDGAIPMGGEQLGEEEILQLLTEMVQSGEITPEELAAALGEGDPAAGGDPAAAGGDPLAGGAPADPAAGGDPAAAGAPPMM